MKKFELNKQTISALDSKSMSEIKGGFTYSLSTGYRCRGSKGAGATSTYDCGIIIGQNLSKVNRCNELVQANNFGRLEIVE